MRIARKNEINEMYEKNLNLLTDWLKESVEEIDEKDLWSRIEVEYNGEGYPMCVYRQDDKRFHITGENPVSEAQQWYRSIPKIGDASAVFLYGSGFGYSIFEIFAQKKAHTIVAVFEEDIYLFKAMLYYFDFQPILESGNFAFLTGNYEHFAQAFEQMFFSVAFLNCTCPVIAYTHAAQRNFKDRYIKLNRELFEKLSLLVSYLGNDHRDNLIGFSNIIANIKEIMESPDLSCLKGKYSGFPAFIIANGPSLDKNIRKLNDIQGRGLIICAESAIVPLMKNHIKPDVLAVIERVKNSYVFHFRDIDYPDDIALLGLALINPNIFPSFPGEKIPIFRDREAVNLWVGRNLGVESNIDAGANVSHLAAEIALYLGADPIVFVGQDYAYGSGDSTHSKDSVYSEEKGKRAQELVHMIPEAYVEGNDGTLIHSNVLWAECIKGLEAKIAVHPDSKFINATEGGAKISGAKCKKLKDVIRQYCFGIIPVRVNELIRAGREKVSVTQKKVGLIRLIQSVESNLHIFRAAAGDIAKGKVECKKMLRLARKNQNGENNLILEEGYQKNIEIISRIIKEEMIICFSQQTVLANYYLINRINMIDTQEKVAEIFKLHYNFFYQLGVILQSTSIHFENALKVLRNELELINRTEGGV